MHRILLDYYLWRTARRWQTSVPEVRKNIAEMLTEARRSADPDAQAVWATIPCEGEAPTMEETVTYLVRQLRENSL